MTVEKPIERPVVIEGSLMRRLWDNHKIIGEIKRSDAMKICVSIVTRDGIKYINVRDFYKKKSADEWKPSTNGIVIPILIPVNKGTERIEVYKLLSEMLAKAADELVDFPLADADNAVYTPVTRRNPR